MGERAECVMLNKGPHIMEAIAALDDILNRMQAHHHKKRTMLRQLYWQRGRPRPALARALEPPGALPFPAEHDPERTSAWQAPWHQYASSRRDPRRGLTAGADGT